MSVWEMTKIGLEYTLIGMGSVFLLLIVIIGFISLLGLMPFSGKQIQKKKDAEAAAKAAAASAEKETAAPAEVLPAEETAAGPDPQIVAAIIAAIAASTGQKGDSFVVRNIRRV